MLRSILRCTNGIKDVDSDLLCQLREISSGHAENGEAVRCTYTSRKIISGIKELLSENPESAGTYLRLAIDLDCAGAKLAAARRILEMPGWYLREDVRSAEQVLWDQKRK